MLILSWLFPQMKPPTALLWGHELCLHLNSAWHPRVSARPPLTYAFRTMGSVSSLISGDSVNSNQCAVPDYRLKKGKTSQKKSGGCSLDNLLKCSFSSNTHPSKRLSHSRSGRSEDFFYIKVRKLCTPIWKLNWMNTMLLKWFTKASDFVLGEP